MFAAQRMWHAVALAVIVVLQCGLAQAKGKFAIEICETCMPNLQHIKKAFLTRQICSLPTF